MYILPIRDQNSPIPPNPTPDPQSAAMVDWMYSYLDKIGGIWPWTTFNSAPPNDYAHPIYFSTPSDPEYTYGCPSSDGYCAYAGAKLRIPAQARPAGAWDFHLCVIDQSVRNSILDLFSLTYWYDAQTGTEWDFWGFGTDPAGNRLPRDPSTGEAPTASESAYNGVIYGLLLGVRLCESEKE